MILVQQSTITENVLDIHKQRHSRIESTNFACKHLSKIFKHTILLFVEATQTIKFCAIRVSFQTETNKNANGHSKAPFQQQEADKRPQKLVISMLKII